MPIVTFVAIVKLTIAGMTASLVRKPAMRNSGTKVSMTAAEYYPTFGEKNKTFGKFAAFSGWKSFCTP